MTRILVNGFRSLGNYGSAMMGLVTLHEIRRRLRVPLSAHLDLFEESTAADIAAELDPQLGAIDVRRHDARPPDRSFMPIRRVRQLAGLLGPSDARSFDLAIVLGGDDLSEYYVPAVWKTILQYGQRARDVPVVLLGQTIGPLNKPINRAVARLVFPRLSIHARDRWCSNYLAENLGIRRGVTQSTDLAWADLPLQHRHDIRAETLARFGLSEGGYATMIVSALRRVYTPDEALYLQRMAELAELVLRFPQMEGRRLCLLAHTIQHPYGDEPGLIARLLPLLSPWVRERVMPVTAPILPTRARFVLGAGLFTLTGRMHAAVSTLQQGKPAVTLAYGRKYDGVIGTMLGRSDLIVQADDPGLWSSGAILDLTRERLGAMLERYDALRAEIAPAVSEQQRMLGRTFDALVRALPVGDLAEPQAT